MKINWTVKLKSDPGLLLLRSIGVVEAILEYYNRVYTYIHKPRTITSVTLPCPASC